MNSVKLQDTKTTYKTLLHTYILTTSYKKEIRETATFTAASKRKEDHITPKLTHRFNAELGKLTLNYVWKLKRYQAFKNVL